MQENNQDLEIQHPPTSESNVNAVYIAKLKEKIQSQKDDIERYKCYVQHCDDSHRAMKHHIEVRDTEIVDLTSKVEELEKKIEEYETN